MATKHPKGLYVLFFTEMWERFGFYLLNALMIYYLTERMHFAEDRASGWMGNYLALVYLSPFVGGLLADRYLGYRRAVLMGAGLLAAGYFTLAFDSTAALYSAVFLLVLGNGLFKPNISTQVGNLYPQGDPRRDSAFSIFYFGINIGGGLSPWVGGIVRQHYGFPAAFATAGIGMLISMVIFAVFHHHVAVANIRSSVSAVLDIPLPQEYEDPRDPPEVERKRILALVIICSIVMMFWMAFQQSGITLSLWARDNTVRTITLVDLHLRPWRVEILPEWFQSVNSVFILTLTPVVVWLFGWLRKSNREPSTPIKIALGMILTALSYVLMVIGSLVGGDKGRVSMLWLISCYFVITIAELFLSPIGLSLVSKLAPRRMTAMLIGVWFIATAIGNKLAGELGRLWSHWPHSRFFALLVASSLIAALILKTQLKRLRASMPPEGPPPDASRSGAELKPAPATT